MAHPIQEAPVETFTVELPASDLPAKSFEERRKGIYSTTPDQLARALELTHLVEAVPIGETSAYDRILEEALEGELASPKAADRYMIVLGNDGLVRDIQHVVTLPEDRKATARAHAMAAHVGWGHKSNDSSFRTRNMREARPRMH